MKLNEQLYKMKTIMGLSETNILNEKLVSVDDDVDYLYDKYFKPVVDAINENIKVTPDMFTKDATNTSILLSEPSVKAHELNPCVITIFGGGGNGYAPLLNTIYLTISQQAIQHLLYYEGNFQVAHDNLLGKSKNIFVNDFSEHRIKGSIHHELTHWIDDTLNNRHINKYINKKLAKIKAGEDDYTPHDINTHYIERQAQIHNIKQVYNYYKNDWDKMTFDELINKTPALYWSKNLPDDMKKQWKQDIMKRMNREGLLGKNMR